MIQQNICLIKNEPKLNPGSWEDPLPRNAATVVNYNGSINNKRLSIDSPLTTTLISNRHNNNFNSNKSFDLNNSAVILGNNTNNRRRLEPTTSVRTISSEESWCSEGVASDRELSSDDDDDDTDRSISSSTPRNSQLRLTFNKAKQHLSFDKWRNTSNNNSTSLNNTNCGSGGGVSSNNNNPSLNSSLNSSSSSSNNSSTMPAAAATALNGGDSSPSSAEPFSRLSRWFSMRRGSTSQQYDLNSSNRESRHIRAASVDLVDNHDSSSTPNSKMPQLNEIEEDSSGFALGLFGVATGRSLASAGATLRNAVSRTIAPSLPPAPAGLSQQALKRRHIVAAIVHSENSYVATLQRLVNDYKKPLEESSPPILSSTKISTLFHRLPEILQCHTLFRIALADCVRNWDRDEKLGDVFISAFSKAIVLDIYSGFINNFSVAMDLAKMEAKRKSALADFFKVKQISAHDRLSFFGLMVKPVQRFPQFILFLQDLLKHTPQGHHDRMSLQLALTQLESLAEMLNERKREAEQYQAFREMMGHISGTFNIRALANSDGAKQRYLLREDNLTQLEFNTAGFIVKSKQRRLLLLNDRVICVSVAPKQSADFGASEKLSFKWMYPVTDVEIVDNSTSATLSRILTAGMNKGGSLRSNASFNSENGNTSNLSNGASNNNGADNLCTEMSNLMHDYEVMSRINDLVRSLKGNYKEINLDITKKLLSTIQSSIQKKDEEMAWVDSCLLQLVIKGKSGKEETFTFQTENPSVKKEWITELRLAQFALDPNNSPAWEIPENELRPLTKMPLFVRSQSVYKSQHQTEVRCGCYYSSKSANNSRLSSKQRNKPQNYVWLCSTDGNNSHISLLSQNNQQASVLKDIGCFDLPEITVTTMEYVKGVPAFASSSPAEAVSDSEMDCVWMATDNKKILIYLAHSPEREEQIGVCTLPAVANQILYHMDNVFVALITGSLLIFRRNSTHQWNLKDYQQVAVSSNELITSLLPVNGNVYAACGKKVWVINGYNGDLLKSFEVRQNGNKANLNLMAHSGIGLWISLKNSSVICLYHTESFKHLQDINIAASVLRVTSSQRDSISNNNNSSSVFVTALMACKGLLWVGTNVGIALTIPLPRLEGVPIISGAVNISYHAHFGPISFFLPLILRNYNFPPPPKIESPAPLSSEPNGNMVDSEKSSENKNSEKTTNENEQKPDNEGNTVTKAKEEPEPEKVSLRKKLEKEFSENSRLSKISVPQSPVVQRRRKISMQDLARGSKTLPRGLGSASAGFMSNTINSNTSSIHVSDHGCDVYGLYGDLIFVKEDYEAEEGQGNLMDQTYESLRRSDPELAAIPAKMSTLDRRLRMKASRPRSLDLSNWSVDSRSSSMYTSSGSEESMGVVKLFGGNNSVSRNSSNASHKFNGSELSNICENNPITTEKPEPETPANNNETPVKPPSDLPVQQSTPNVPQTHPMTATLKRNNGKKAKHQQPVELMGRRTVLTLMGGRGYINWRHVWYNTHTSQDTNNRGHARSNSISVVPKLPNGNDAHIVIWEKKL
uniref:CSON003326 protein n=1 Tax=Culicoides sonorensis TaxID=179676 RepID=A0A336LM44_CULSO